MTVINKIRDYQSNAERDISMIDTVIHFMVHNQVFTLFICMALGFAIGDYKFGGRFSIGATVATLVVTLIVGQIGAFPRDEMLGTIFFGAFMFSVGYRIGPQMMISLKIFGSRILIVSIFWLLSAFLDYVLLSILDRELLLE